jgi:hypothetical protein
VFEAKRAGFLPNINKQVAGAVEVGCDRDDITVTALTQWRVKCFDGAGFYCSAEETHMSFEEAFAMASRDEGFKATVYAMNTLLIRKGLYTQTEFQALFVEWVEKEQRRKTSEPRRTEVSSAYSA